MARESVTIQCYPSDSVINAKVRQYEAFGWELINNQKFQEYTGQTTSGDTVTRHYSTYNKLTFSRDKSEPWYEEVTKLEREYKHLENRQDDITDYKPRNRGNNAMVTLLLVGAILAVILNVILGFAMATSHFVIAGIITVVPVLIILVRALRKKSYNRKLSQWHSLYDSELKEIDDKMEELCDKAEALVNG